MIESKEKKERVMDLSHIFEGKGLVRIGLLHHLEFLFIGLILLPLKTIWIGGLFFLLIFLGMNSLVIMTKWYVFWSDFKIFKKKQDKENEIKESLITQTIDKKLLEEIDKVNKNDRDKII